MQVYEVNTIIENLPYLDRTSWEQSRFQIYSSVQINTKKKINPTDIMKFAWDNDKEDITISNDDIERLKEKSKQIYQTIINNGK